MGVWNESGLPLSGEIWIDELRLGRAVRDAGIAGSFNATFDGAGVLRTRLNITDRGAFFRQLRDPASYQNDRLLNLTSTLAADRWLPGGWGVDLPVTFEHSRASQAPVLLANSDVRADQIANLRPTERAAIACRVLGPEAHAEREPSGQLPDRWARREGVLQQG